MVLSSIQLSLLAVDKARNWPQTSGFPHDLTTRKTRPVVQV